MADRLTVAVPLASGRAPVSVAWTLMLAGTLRAAVVVVVAAVVAVARLVVVTVAGPDPRSTSALRKR